MNRKEARPGRRWFVTILLTYVSIFVLVGLLVGLLYSRIQGTVQDTILSGYRHQLEVARDGLERSVSRAVSFAALLGEDEAVRRLSLADADSLRTRILDMRAAHGLMRNSYGMLGEEFVSAMLLFPRNAYLVSNFMVSDDYSRHYGELFGQSGFTAQQWYEDAMGGDKRNLLKPWLESVREFHSQYLPGESRHSILLAVPVSTPEKTRRMAVALYYLNEEWIEELVPREQEVGFALQGSDGTLLCGELSSEEHRLTLSMESQEGPGFSLTLWVPYSVISGQLSNITRLVRWYVVLGLGGILLLSLFYAARQMLSLRPLLAFHGGVSPERYASPYRYALDLLESMASTRDTLQQRLRLLESTYNENLLESLCCRGIGSSHDYEAGAALLGERAENYCVAVLHIGDEHRLSSGLLDAEEAIEDALAPVVLHMSPEESVYIIGLSRPGGVEAVCHILGQQLTAFGLVGVSGDSADIHELHGRYQQARSALTRCENGVLLQAYSGEVRRTPVLDLQRLSTLENLILTGRSARVSAFFEELEGNASALVGVDQFQFFFVLRQLLSRTRLTLGDRASMIDVPAFISDERAQESIARLRECAVALSGRAEEGKIESRTQSASTMIALIESDFVNPDLSADYIAGKLGCSARFVYQTVRDETGHTVGEVIESTRLQFAEELLLGTAGKNEEIAERCGFGTLNTFYRAFRRSHGISPGEWRRQKLSGL